MSVRPRGSFGIDAPWVPWMWVGFAIAYAALAVAAATSWDAWWWVVALVAVGAAVFAAGAALYWYASLRGKFVLWSRLLSATELPSGAAVLDLGCGHGMVTIMTALRFPDSTVTGIDLWRRFGGVLPFLFTSSITQKKFVEMIGESTERYPTLIRKPFNVKECVDNLMDLLKGGQLSRRVSAGRSLSAEALRSTAKIHTRSASSRWMSCIQIGTCSATLIAPAPSCIR